MEGTPQGELESADVAAAIRALADRVDALGNAVISAGELIANAIRSTNTGGTGVSQSGTFT